MADIILISNARLSFPHIAEPQTQTDKVTGTTRTTYNCDLILEPNSKGYQEFMAQFANLAQIKWKENAQGAMQQIHANRKQRCYGAGEEKVDSKTFQVRSGYANKVYISASNSQMPQIIGADGKATDNTMAAQALARKMYGGCFVNAAIKPWLQQNATAGIGVRCELVAVQFCADGEPFGEAPIDTTGMFAPVAATPAGLSAPIATVPGIPGLPSFFG